MNSSELHLNQPVQYLKGVGPQKAQSLQRLHIATVKDLLYYFPRRYEDRSHFEPIGRVREGDVRSVKGRVLTLGTRYIPGNRSIFQLAVGDETGIIYGSWFNQPYLKTVFKVGDEVILYGTVERYGKLQISAPEYEIIRPDEEDATIHTGRIVPIYPLTASVSQRYLRSLAHRAVSAYSAEVSDFLPAAIVERHQLIGLRQALEAIHFPQGQAAVAPARRRLIFDEFFLLQLALALKRSEIKDTCPGISFIAEGNLRRRLAKSLPFQLTKAQQQAVSEIEKDMAAEKPMNRLLQGDVGSGKTVVSVWALSICVQNGYQAVFMAPTEILARQHFRTVEHLLAPLGVRTRLLVGSLKKKERDEILAQAQAHAVDVLIGTHALIQDEVNLANLGLVIVDEQHKFGVMQRMRLQRKSARMPDVLVMSATPIPRTLAITVFGDLDVSTLRELPPGRTPVQTFWISEKKRHDLYRFLRDKISGKQQVYVVYPVVEKSKVADLKAATKMYEHFREDIFPSCRVGLLHGRMKDEEKKSIMEQFKAGELDILVATTVIEVGIDVPNASVMVIEHAERFGLSQLHQLRGRVGRGQQQAFCILMSEGKNEETVQRLSAMTKTTDGFAIAEQDLIIRGPGEFFGTRQHGMPELRIGNILHDQELLTLARQDAFDWFSRHAGLSAAEKENIPLRRELQERFTENGELLRAR
ncbi:MAG: ATP-dependent DNA helicase RecG [Candidatus Omnitrophica bacterium]|nr:ATP-dependent DNA helicase RecG [Candidatus Omnitrophota bacterium]